MSSALEPLRSLNKLSSGNVVDVPRYFVCPPTSNPDVCARQISWLNQIRAQIEHDHRTAPLRGFLIDVLDELSVKHADETFSVSHNHLVVSRYNEGGPVMLIEFNKQLHQVTRRA